MPGGPRRCSAWIAGLGLAALVGTGEPAAAEPLAPAGPYATSADIGVEVGLFFASQAKLGLSVGRTIADVARVDAGVRLGAGSDLLVHEETLRAGLVLDIGARTDLLLGWRLGLAHFRIRLPAEVVTTRSYSLGIVADFQYLLSPRMELHLAPAVPIGYVNEFWGFVMAVEAGAAYRF